MKKKPRKVTGELELFKEIWGERPHKCTVCDVSLPVFTVRFFAHILSKGSEPAARLDKYNIVIACFPCHWNFDNATHEARNNPLFKWVFELKDKLKLKYNGRQEK